MVLIMFANRLWGRLVDEALMCSFGIISRVDALILWKCIEFIFGIPTINHIYILNVVFLCSYGLRGIYCVRMMFGSVIFG